MTPLYTAIAKAHGGREGRVQSSDGVLDHELQMPKEIGGRGGHATNPEQLFAAGYAACFESALRLVARTQKIALSDAHIEAHVTLNKSDDGGFGLSVVLHGKIEGIEKDAAQKLMEAAHHVCPYSKATKGNIDVKLVAD